MKKYFPYLGIAVILCVIWLVWPDKRGKDDSVVAQDEQQTSSASSSESGSQQGLPGKRSGGVPRDDGFPPQEKETFDSPEVDMILTDTSITDEEAVRRLRQLVEDSTLRMSSRGEALRHGLNLSIDRFADMAEQSSDLPFELAEIFLAEMMNRNEVPVIQLRTYLALMNHPEQEMANQSLEQLRFMVGDDKHEETELRIIELAMQKINQLHAEDEESKQAAQSTSRDPQAE